MERIVLHDSSQITLTLSGLWVCTTGIPHWSVLCLPTAGLATIFISWSSRHFRSMHQNVFFQFTQFTLISSKITPGLCMSGEIWVLMKHFVQHWKMLEREKNFQEDWDWGVPRASN